MFEVLIVQPIFNLLLLIYSVIPWGDFGLTLIIFTAIIRLILYPLVKKQLHQTKMMRKLQPELKRIKKEAAGDKQQEATEMMNLYKRYGVSPFRSMLILFIQLPIFIGLYQVIHIMTSQRDQIAKHTYDFIKAIEPVQELIAHPESFNQKMLGFIDLTKTAFGDNQINIPILALAVISAITQYYMSKQTMPTDSSKPKRRLRDIMNEAAEGKRHDQQDMNEAMMSNMAKIMPIMMFFIMVGLPGAIALYYTISNIIAVAQQAYLLRQDEEELEEIADEPVKQSSKHTSAKQREKQADKAQITRIKAKDTLGRKMKERKR